jgi:hypothetical protein
MNDQQIDSIIAYLRRSSCRPSSARAASNLCEGGKLPKEKQDEIQKAIDAALAGRQRQERGRGHLQPHPRLGPRTRAHACHTNGWSYGNPLVSGRRRARPQPDGRRRGAAVPERRRTTSRSSRLRPSRARSTASRASRPAGCPAFGSYYNAEQLAALITYIRSL